MLSVSPTPAVTVKAETAIEPLVVSLETTAKLLSCSDRHIRNYLDSIPHIRIGNRLLFRVDALRHWLESKETTAK